MNPQNNIIVKESAKTVRAMARQTLSGRWQEALWVSLMMYAITTLPSIVIPYISGTSFTLSAVNVYTLIVSGPMALGISIYFLKVFRQRPGGMEDLLRGFNYMWKSFVLVILMAVRIFLLSLLFVIPGILAALRYSQAFFIMADAPEKSPRQCLWESGLLMQGNRSRFFVLELSFLGWALLASLPPAAGHMLWGPDTAGVSLPPSASWTEILSASMEAAAQPIHPLLYLLSIGTVFLGIYMTASHACFYDLVNGNLQVRRTDELHTLAKEFSSPDPNATEEIPEETVGEDHDV
ncbi:MAG: DUF975 family protein [Bacillota bacterium]|jgi:uncharacterized membrane protein|nr:DUF975 family protein [Eubacteriales bacterium]MDI9492057.1 DUF975 family protein [Bacillota bacterium]NLV70451.1 DUF975 family protein [Clostridiales bacterium]MDD3536986.1 DUF975 family protein [Eubacteriales bacterium]MDD4285425.1 DUF975 family protein [Eubacteriales bacterium]